ncbi:MAG: glycosyltransferase family 4 protein [Alphaproteobacteria bacterium]|nr:glycosyltransferase family 4 protein [Alphaproteobacteria bacterium]
MDDRVSARAATAVQPRIVIGPKATKRHVALIGNFPPRRCGIATFTEDLYRALLDFGRVGSCDIYAMIEPGASYAFPGSVKMAIQQQNLESYLEAARRINASGADTVSLQHEYGIFGGAAGEHIISLLAALRVPVVTTLHTVLERPDPAQRRVMEKIIAHSAQLVVMAQKGHDILRRVYGAPPSKIVVTPHGAPDVPREPSERYKKQFGWAGRRTILTFGLLSPNKGIEHMLAAMPSIAAAHPDALYVVLGATHPHLKAHEGERYRESLIAQVEALGISDNVLFLDAFVDNQKLFDYLRATDVYVTPYLHEAQITSGTLAYAVALGRAIVSTPYWHASEVLADERGILCPFADAPSLARAVDLLLADDAVREGYASRAYALGRGTTWQSVSRRYAKTFRESDHKRVEPVTSRAHILAPARLPAINLAGVEGLTDGRGIMQHTVFGVADRAHGYCLDDAARALILANDVRALSGGEANPALIRLARDYAAFVQHAWNGGDGCFRNFMSFEGRWLEERGSGDSFGRAVWAVGSTVQRGATPLLRQWAANLAGQIAPHVQHLEAPRSRALASLGLAGLVQGQAAPEVAGQTLHLFATDLAGRLDRTRTPDWVWFEDHLSYDNARLPEALIRASTTFGDGAMLDAGLQALAWLCNIQTAEEGWFRPVGSTGFGARYAQPSRFDQQPLEAAATIDACQAAYEATNDARWISEARKAYAWYLGANDLGLPVAVPEEGICFDGLTPYDVNRNQGAESVLAFQSSTCAMHALLRSQALVGAIARAS